MADASVDVDFDASFHADAGLEFTTFSNALANLPVADPPTPEEALDQIFGTDTSTLATTGVWIAEMSQNADFNTDPLLADAAAISLDPDSGIAAGGTSAGTRRWR